MAGEATTFIDYVQNHERAWGNDSYPQRPTLSELLMARVVAWWHDTDDDKRLMATVHDDLDALNKYATRLLLHSRLSPPDHRLALVHINQKKGIIRGVMIDIAEPD